MAGVAGTPVAGSARGGLGGCWAGGVPNRPDGAAPGVSCSPLRSAGEAAEAGGRPSASDGEMPGAGGASTKPVDAPGAGGVLRRCGGDASAAGTVPGAGGVAWKVRTARPMWIWSWSVRGVGAVRRRPLRPVPLREASWRVQVAPARVRRAWMREIWSSAGRRTSAFAARPMVISSAAAGRGQRCVPNDSANSVSTNTPPGSRPRRRDSAFPTRIRSRAPTLMRLATLVHQQVTASARGERRTETVESVINQVSCGARRS